MWSRVGTNKYVPLLVADTDELCSAWVSKENENAIKNSLPSKLERKEIKESFVHFKNSGDRRRTNKLYNILETAKQTTILDSIPPGKKSDMTFIVERKNFNNGPGAMLDDKAPYSGGYGANAYAYNVSNNQFVSVMSKKISTSGSKFTYKNEKKEDVVLDKNWIIHWSARCERKKLNAVLKSNDF